MTLSPDREPTPLKPQLRRLCLFAFRDDHGIVDDYITFLLQELSPFAQKIIFFSNGPLAPSSGSALNGLVADIRVLPAGSNDLLAYKIGLEEIRFDTENRYDEIMMVNDTCYGPIYPFSELFEEMETRNCDFWGVTFHMERTPNPCAEIAKPHYHLDTNFIVVRSKLLHSQPFKRYWNNLKPENVDRDSQTAFTEYFTKLGYTCNTYLDCQKYGTHLPALVDADETLADRNPLLRRDAFLHDPRLLEHYASDLPHALHVLEQTSNYDRSLIWRNVIRSAELRNLNTNAALTSVLPDVRFKQSEPTPNYGHIAVCAHVYYTEMLEEILSLADTIPCPYDFIATTETEAKKSIIEDALAGRKNVTNVIVRVVEQNRGRDMSSLFITCRDLFLDDRYDLVCRLHTKKSPQVAAGRANMFKRHMFENLLNSPGFTANVLDMFHDSPWIGVAVPPLVHIAYPTMGHVWFINRAKANELAELLDLKISFDPDTPVGAFGTMFWFRPKALHKLFAHPWQWTDFNAEPNHVDGGLAHVLERLICYVAQDAHYTTQQIISSHLASWNLAMLEYKVQKMSASLPNPDFNYQCNFLEEWKRSGYKTVHATELTDLSQNKPQLVEQPVTVRQAFDDLFLSAKHSISYRAPVITKILRPIYHAFRKALGNKTE